MIKNFEHPIRIDVLIILLVVALSEGITTATNIISNNAATNVPTVTTMQLEDFEPYIPSVSKTAETVMQLAVENIATPEDGVGAPQPQNESIGVSNVEYSQLELDERSLETYLIGTGDTLKVSIWCKMKNFLSNDNINTEEFQKIGGDLLRKVSSLNRPGFSGEQVS